jgi:hypothetical protein
MATLPRETISIIRHLQSKNIDPLLYGSQGVSLYLGSFKPFGDVDLLIADGLLHAEWPLLQQIMNQAGFKLHDEREHEFSNDDGQSVGFASENILLKDKIIENMSAVVSITVSDVRVRTLDIAGFKRAYEFSVKDGYRKDVRNKKDEYIISLIQRYIDS